jgi:hypothetical protein
VDEQLMLFRDKAGSERPVIDGVVMESMIAAQ